MFFSSVISKKLNQEILTKNLVTLKRRNWVKNKKFECYQGSLKNLIFRREGPKKPIYKGGGGGGGQKGGLEKFAYIWQGKSSKRKLTELHFISDKKHNGCQLSQKSIILKV